MSEEDVKSIVESNQTVTMKFVLNAEQVDAQWRSLFNRASEIFLKNAQKHGFTPEKGTAVTPEFHATRMALIHTEVAEATEAIRNGNPEDEKVKGFSNLEIELADVIIRIMEYAAFSDLNLGDAILAKHNYNVKREHKHGGKLF